MTTFSDQVYQLGGVPVGGLFSMGKVFFVRPATGSDENKGDKPARALKTLAKAQALAVANRGDVVYLIAESNTSAATTDYQAAALTWAKDGVHLIGVGAGVAIGQRARISNLSTATAIVDGLVRVTANNCLIQNIAIYQGVAGTNPTGASIALLVSGERNKFVNCSISGIGHAELDDATSRSLKVTGGENLFEDCYIGLDTIIRATATAEVEVGDIARTIFKRCIINTYTSLTTFKIVTYAAPDRFIMFKDCTLNAVNNITSAVQPTGALAAATTVNGQIILHNTAVFGCVNVTTADDARVLVSAPAGGIVDMGLGTAVDIV